MPSSTFVATLETLAAERRLDRKQLSYRSHVDSGSLSRIFSGSRPAGRALAAQIIRAFPHPNDRAELVRAYLLDVARDLGQVAEIPAVAHQHEENLADLIDAPLYALVRSLALAATRNPALRDLLEDLQRIASLSHQIAVAEPPAAKRRKDAG